MGKQSQALTIAPNFTVVSFCGFKYVGLQPPRSPKLEIFGITVSKGYIPLSDFTKFAVVEAVPDPHTNAKFRRQERSSVDTGPAATWLDQQRHIELPEKGFGLVWKLVVDTSIIR